MTSTPDHALSLLFLWLQRGSDKNDGQLLVDSMKKNTKQKIRQTKEERDKQRTEKDQAVISQLVSYTLKNNTVQQVQVNLVTFHKRREALVDTAGESDLGSRLKSWVAVQAADGDVSLGSVS